MIPIFKNRVGPKRKILISVVILIAGALITSVAYAQVGALNISIKAGDPTELMADGKSQTTLMFDLSGCVWYPTAGPKDLLQLQFTSNLGTSLTPPSILKTIEEVGSPFQVVMKSGTQYGTAKVTASASYCSEDNTMVFGTCSSQQEQNNPKCTGDFEIPVRPAGASEEGEESSEESEETEELGVSISCPPSPKAGTSVTCTANVSGAKQNETLDYFWSLDGAAGTGTKDNTYTWKGNQTGYYDVSVEVFGQDRTAKKTIRVEVVDSDTSEEEEDTSEESPSSATNDFPNLVSDLESFLKAAGVKNINPAKLAVAGTGVSALIAIWMITQNRSGVPMEKLEKALGQWRWREGQKVPKPASEVEKKAPPEKLPEDVPEGLKSDKGANKPVILPEESSEAEAVSEDHTGDADPLTECTSCGNHKVPGVSYCPHCKEKYEIVSEEVAEAEASSEDHIGDADPLTECTSCGNHKVPGVSYCPHCKEKYEIVSEEVAEAEASSEKGTSDGADPKKPDPLRDCHFCGNVFIAGANFCHHCGSPQSKVG